MNTILSGRCLIFLVASGLPALAAAATVADDGAAAAAPDAQIVELADLRHKAGKHPQGGVILAGDGNYYGTARDGGRHGFGTVYRVEPGGVVKALYDFKGQADGRAPLGALVQGTDGALYGVADGSRDRHYENLNGVIFRVALDGTFQVLHALAEDGSEGMGLNAPLIQGRDGQLYGTATYGGVADGGVVFSVPPTGGYAVLARFEPGGPSQPLGPPLEADDGDFYVTASVGGPGYGAILHVSRDTGRMKTLYVFTGNDAVDGGYPRDSLAYDAAHAALWGVNYRCVYRYGIATGEARAVTCFDRYHPGMVTLGPDATHFYVLDKFSALSIAPDGRVKTLARLPGPASRNQQLIIDASGALVGTTMKGGADDVGTVFRIEGY
jgi:uncharacterized repeat protein (TIGR03803 family)